MANSLSTTALKWPSAELASPFQSLSRKLYPTTVLEVLAWGEELWLHHGLYTQAIKKAVRYFMTEIELDGPDISEETKVKYNEVLEDDTDLLDDLALIGDDYVGFGNSFTSVHTPFIRNLICPKCGSRAPLTRFWPYVKFENFTFRGKCPFPGCTHKGDFKVKDLRVPKADLRLIINRWPPQLISIEKHPWSKKAKYFLDVTKYTSLVQNIKNGNQLFLEETPWEIIKCIQHGKRLEFADDALYHMSNEPAAVSAPGLNGWGLPSFMAEFETAILVFLLDKYNETVLTDYLIPFRVISPAAGRSSVVQKQTGDVMLNLGMGDFVSKVKQMIQRHRKNPTDWNFSPIPLEYQILGGEAKNLTPVELMEHFEQRLLHSMGIPQEFSTSSIQDKAAPLIGFKMFERSWQHFSTEINKWLNWYIGKQAELRNWEAVKASLVPVSVYEDPMIQESIKELYAANKVSESTYFRYLGLNSAYEQKRIMAEQAKAAKLQNEEMLKADKDAINTQAIQTAPAGQQMLEQQQMAEQGAEGGAPMPPGGAPMGASGVAPIGGGAGMGNASLDKMMAEAEQIASQIMVMEPSQRKSALIDLKKTNEALHAQVKSNLETMENQNAQQGVILGRQGQMQ